MSTEAISPLRQRMIEDMNSRKLGAHMQRSHVYSCKRFAAFLERSPDTATLEDIRLFQLRLAETGMSICNRNRIMTGVRFLLRVTLRRFNISAEYYHLREPQKIPQGCGCDCKCSCPSRPSAAGTGECPQGYPCQGSAPEIRANRVHCRCGSLCMCAPSLREFMSSIMRWRSGLIASVLIGNSCLR